MIIIIILITILVLAAILPAADAIITYRKKRKDTVTKLYSYINVDLDPQIKRVRQLVTDEIINKEEDTGINKTDPDRIHDDWDIVQSCTDIIKSDKFSYRPEKRYIIHDCSYDLPGYEPEVKDVCVIVEIDEKGKPYYSIRYMTNDDVCHVGYGSYKLKTVLMYFKDYFECKEG